MSTVPCAVICLKKMSSAARVCATAAASLVGAGPAAAANTSGPDRHANCTAGFAAGSAHQGSPAAVGSVAQPPEQYGSLSDVGYYSRTNCA